MTKKHNNNTRVRSRFCVIKGCEQTPVCLDSKGYTILKGGHLDLDLMLVEEPVCRDPSADAVTMDEVYPEVWYCHEHAVEHLFPLIDQAQHNTTSDILQDFREDGLM